MKAAFAVFAIFTCLLASNAGASSTLNDNQKLSLDAWLNRHPQYTIATDQDCDCDEDIVQERTVGSSGSPTPDFHPYLLVGDFRKNGQSDFAVVVKRVDDDRKTRSVLLIFDGPFRSIAKQPTLVHGLNYLNQTSLFQTRQDGYPIYGAFESEGCLFVPQKRTYVEDCGNF